MGYYDLSADERKAYKIEMEKAIVKDLENHTTISISEYFSDEDTYIRKNGYLAIGSIYKQHENFRIQILSTLKNLLKNSNEKIRQTVVNSLGEIGKINFEVIVDIFKLSFADNHHSVLNALTGALKQLGEKNPQRTIRFIQDNLRTVSTKLQIKLLHGLELHGRTHPEDILPILKEYQNTAKKDLRKMIIHIISQISYKNGCLEKVLEDLKTWDNKVLKKDVLKEIILVHYNYQRFSSLAPEQVEYLIKKEFGGL